MCLIVFSHNDNANYKLVLAANRDEFLERPTEAAHFWKENEDILAGKDLRNGGTWLGLNKNGKLVALTNYRNPKDIKAQAPSRGIITRDFLNNGEAPTQYIKAISAKGLHYNGYNLLMRHKEQMYHYSNITKTLTALANGTYGLSNALLDTLWPKVQDAKSSFREIVNNDSFSLDDLTNCMQHYHIAADELLPTTGVPLEVERLLSPMFIKMKGYGTRCTTVLTIDSENHLQFRETNYDEHFEVTEVKNFEFYLKD